MLDEFPFQNIHLKLPRMKKVAWTFKTHQNIQSCYEDLCQHLDRYWQLLVGKILIENWSEFVWYLFLKPSKLKESGGTAIWGLNQIVDLYWKINFNFGRKTDFFFKYFIFFLNIDLQNPVSEILDKEICNILHGLKLSIACQIQ